MIVQMSGLGKDQLGRFGNQLFSFFFLKVVEAQLGCEIRYPNWMGNVLFALPESAPILPPAKTLAFEHQLKFEGVDFSHQASRENGPLAEIEAIRAHLPRDAKALDLLGYFQYHTSTYAAHQDLFAKAFRFNAHIEQQVDQALSRLGLADQSIVCVHVRRGDYLVFDNRHPLFWGSSFDALAKALDDLRLSSLKNFTVYLCSDDIAHCQQEFQARGIPCITNADLFGSLDNPNGLMVDFMMMAKSNALIISNSSLSFAAAMVNRKARIFLRPCPKEDRLIPFDPWSSHVLLPKFPYVLN